MAAKKRELAQSAASSGINPSAPQGYAAWIKLASDHQRGINRFAKARLPVAVGADTPERTTVRF